MSVFQIDGVDMPAPTKFELPDYDLHSEDSFRDETGVLHAVLVRAGVYKIPIAWNILTTAELLKIKNAVRPGKFNVRFPNETGYVTKSFRAGDKNTKIVLFNADHDKILWSLSFDLTEY